ncbi:MAG TPA: prepilin-type N-terminal cleavage/methylation domain-containing protein [Gemmataceae bacterium]|nr:prepilin-type N-terminal cleavage/methylation domain-containing protein [Gemmataceae bacterium]
MRQRHMRKLISRRAFTLVEMMVVITIILVIIGLTAGAYIRFIGSQRQSNTVLLLQKVSNALNHHWQAVVDQAKNDTIPGGVLTWAGNDQERARVLWIKLRLKYEFPMSRQELVNPWAGTTDPTYGNPFQDTTYPSPKLSYLRATSTEADAQKLDADGLMNLSPQQQSAVLLYLALSEKRRGVNFDPDKELGDNEVATVTTQSPETGQTSVMKMIVDAWGNPVSFFRWPTGSQDPVNGGQVQNGLVDPQDPRGKLADKNWLSSTSGPQYYSACVNVLHQIPAPPPLGTSTTWPQSYQLVPVVASAGPDKVFALTPSMELDTTNYTAQQAQGYAQDNIYSYDKRMGKGG